MEEVNETVTPENVNKENIKVVQTDEDAINGQKKCPKCGATDISLNKTTGKLRCRFCRYEFEPEKVEGMVEDLSQLEGQVVTSGVQDIAADASDVVTLKCTSCGAEVVIDTASSMQARCHWCRNTLSINQQIPNGSVPDVVLPFSIKKEDAESEIQKFVGKRKFFAHPIFRKEFTTNNIMGVYFPYMLVDVNAHANLIGEGEHQTRCYTVGSGDNKETYYDADLYHVEREFDITIDDLSIESSSDKLDTTNKEKTTNIINSIMPFDTENCVKYDANYLKGFTSEKRDVNVDQIKSLVDAQAQDIARFAANDTLKKYDRGVAWSDEQFTIKGEQWLAAYLPVWLYSYQQIKGNKKMLHYVAVNARTKETMGSVPIHMPKLFIVSFLVEILGVFATILLSGSSDSDSDYSFIFLLSGFIYFAIMYARYRNSGARHTYETETKKEVSNMKVVDQFLRSKTRLKNSRMDGANNTRLNGKTSSSKVLGRNILDSAINGNPIASAIKDNIKKK